MVLVFGLVAMAGLAVAAPVLAWVMRRDTGYVLAAGFIAVAVLLGSAGPGVLAGGTVAVSWPWIPALGVSATFRMDGLSALFCVLVLGVGALIMAYCPRYLSPEGRHGLVYFLLAAFGGAMLGLVLAGDLVLMLVFWEATTIISFFLIGSIGPKGAKPAVRALIVTVLGGLTLLAAVVLIGAVTGSTDLETVLGAREQITGSPLAPAIAALIIVSAFTKSAQVPFGFWLPGAMVAITPVSAYLHAATMVKAGIYLLLRFSTVFAEQPAWSLTLLGFGLTTAVLAALRALRQHDLKALLAYSTVSQLGLLVAAIGVGTAIALAAAILHTFAHALFKATLFMLVGVIDREAGSRDIRRLSGLMRAMPVAATLTGLAGLSLAGVAPLIGFVSKESLFQGFGTATVFPGAGSIAVVMAVVASALTFAYGMRIFYGVFAGPTVQRNLYEPSWLFLAPAAVAAVAGVVLGPAVAVLNPLMRRAMGDVLPWAQPPHFAMWHGLSPEVVASAVTVTLGMVLFLARGRVERALSRLPDPRWAARFDRGYKFLVRFGAIWSGRVRREGASGFLARPLTALVLLAVTGLLVGGSLDLTGDWQRSTPVDWVAVVLLAAAVLAIIQMRSALGAVVSLGLIGLITTIWFLAAGAPDVAMTLLMVELLTAVAAALALRGLPARWEPAGRRRTLAAAALAIAVGAAAAAGALAFTGHRDISTAGEYFLQAAEPQTGGRNVVNTILVDFRAADTLGEVTVLAAAALGILALKGRPREDAAGQPVPYGSVLGPAQRVLTPAILLLALFLLLRGHDQPGGGFIAALVAGIAVALGVLAGRGDWAAPLWHRPAAIMGIGLLACIGTGLLAIMAGHPFLSPVKGPWGGSSSWLFDAGVFVVVLGLIITVVRRLAADGLDKP